MSSPDYTLSRKNRGNLFFWTIILGIYIAAWLIQAQLCIHWDISKLLQATRLMLAGGTYSKDFFIPNPPMILFLYTPPVVLSKLMNIKVIVPFRLYIFLLNTLSFGLCCLLAQKIFSKKDGFIAGTFLAVLASIFLIVPGYQFGQRDCLLLVLMMPYLLAIALQLQGRPIPTKLAGIIGLLAALGLAIKPYFLIIFIVIESYFLYSKRNILAWVRTEVEVIVLIFAIYGTLMFAFFPDFVFVVTPYILGMYHKSLSIPLSQLFFNPIAFFCWLSIPFFIVRYSKNPYKILCTVLLLALIGFLISYYAQRTLFIYHIIPPFSLTILLLALLFVLFISENSASRQEYFTMLLPAILSLVFLLRYESAIWTVITFDPKIFFGFFAFLFAFLFSAMKMKKLRMICYTVFITLIGLLSSFLARHIDWYPHHFLITMVTLISLFALLAPKTHKKLGEHIFIAILGILIFSFPVYVVKNMYGLGVAYKEKILSSLIHFMNTQPPKQSIYVFSVMANYSAPLTDYMNANSVERFDCLWMVGDLAQQLKIGSPDLLHQYIKNNKDERFFLNMVAEDIQDKKPDLIFVDARNKNITLNGHDAYFDLLSYFLDNPKLRHEWQHYYYLTTIAAGSPYSYNYRLQVYKRI